MSKAFVISADEIKKTLPGYTPAQSGKFHRESTRLADKKYTQAVKTSSCHKVILLSGGSASGKTEYMSGYLLKQNAIIIDGTLPTIDGFKIKLRAAKQRGKQIEIHAVIPDDLKRAYTAFLERERKYDEKYFYITHSQSRKTLLDITREYSDIHITLIESHVGKDNLMSFDQLKFDKINKKIDYLNNIQYSEEEIVKQVLAL